MRMNILHKAFLLILSAFLFPLIIYSSFLVIELQVLKEDIKTNTSEYAFDLLENNTMQIVDATERQISAEIEEDVHRIKTLSSSMAKPLYEKDFDTLEWQVDSVLENNPSNSLIWVVNSTNIIVSGSNHSYFQIGSDLSEDSIHLVLLDLIDQGYNFTNFPLVTFDPMDVGNGVYGMGYNFPIFYNETYIGFVIMTRTWFQFQELVASVKISTSGSLLLINSNGDMIAGNYYNNTEPYSINFFELNPDYNSTKSILEKDSDVFQITITGSHIVFCYKWIEIINNNIPELQTLNFAQRWAVVTVFSIDEFIAPIEQLNNEIQHQIETTYVIFGILLLLMSIAGFGFALYSSKWFTTPIRNLIKTAEEIGDGNFDIQVETTSDGDIGELIRTFNQMVRNLSKKERMLKMNEKELLEALNRGEFFKDIFAHDINNILHSITLGLDLLEYKESISEECMRLLQRIRNELIKGRNLTTNIRKLSELEEKEIPLLETKIDEVLLPVIELIKKENSDKQIDIQILSSISEKKAIANKYLKDVFYNILDNAVIHNDRMPIKITIDIKDYKGKIGNLHHKIEITDNGKGISDQTKNEIFERHNASKSVYGVGLGLSLTKKIIDIYNGKIWCEDRIKGDFTQGSKFIFLVHKNII